MAKTRKVILLLVEGITDKVCLEAILPAFIENEEITFQITCGDVTTEDGVDAQNIVKQVNAHIQNHLTSNHFKKSDIAQIIHLIDTDGAFIADDSIVYADVEHIQYYPDRIESKNVNAIKIRNHIKVSALNKLSSKSKIASMNYSVYYFSSNLEHVFHNIQKDLSKEEKMVLAEKFSDQYADNSDGFLMFMNSIDFAVAGDYRESWSFIKNNCNSLNRYCNFHIYLNS